MEYFTAYYRTPKLRTRLGLRGKPTVYTLDVEATSPDSAARIVRKNGKHRKVCGVRDGTMTWLYS